jgi:hypothetical protein
MADAGIAEYKSPKYKLATIFKNSRDTWKQKHVAVKKKLKWSQNRLRQVEASRAYWQERAKKAEEALAHEQQAIIDSSDDGKKKPAPKVSACSRKYAQA